MNLHTGGPEDALTCSRDEEVAHGKEFSCDGEVNLNFKKKARIREEIQRTTKKFFIVVPGIFNTTHIRSTYTG
jgi:hypothetical protein